MIVLATMRDTLAWRVAHLRRVTPSDATALLARPDTKRHTALVERLVLDFEGVEPHTLEHVDPWVEMHELDLIAALACYRKRHPDATVATYGFVQHDDHSWLGASPHGLIDDGETVLRFRPHYSLRAYSTVSDNKAECARQQLLMFVTGAVYCDVCDFWDGRGDVPDRLAVRRVDFDAEWLTANVFPRIVQLWARVRQTLAARAA